MATAPSPNDLTRQQLDELDALLQRMLAIPLNPPDPPPAPPGFALSPPPLPGPAVVPIRPTPNWRVDAARPAATAPPPHVVPPPAVEAPRPTPEPVRAAPEPPRPTPPGAVVPPPATEPAVPPVEPEPATLRHTPPGTKPTEELEPQADADSEPDFPAAHFAFAAAMATPVEAEGHVASVKESAPPARVSRLLLPFVVFNFLIDYVLRLTGLPGRVLTSGPVKTSLGVVGLGLIGYTAAYLGQQQGWISLPVQVPWPR